MKRHSFTDFKYQLVDSNVLDKKCVEVTFLFDGKSSIHYVFIDKDKGNYISEAKRIVDAQLKSGKLARIGKKCARVRPFPNIVKPLLISLACVVGVGAVGATGYFAYKTLTTQSEGGGGGEEHHYKPGEEVEVTKDIIIPSGSGYSVEFKKEEAIVGEAYSTSIVLKKSKNDDKEYRLPDFCKVTSNTTVLKDGEYKYKLIDNNNATLNIEAEYVYGPVTVSFSLTEVNPGPGPTPTDTYIVDFNGAGCSATLKGEVFTSDAFNEGDDIELTISPLTDRYELSDTISVKINGVEATAGEDYTYTKIGDTKDYKLGFIVKGRTDINVGTTEYCLLTYDCSAAKVPSTTEWIKKEKH